MNGNEMIIESEIEKLASEMKASGVHDYKGVTDYIKTRDLAKLYPHITGQLTFWKFGESEFVREGRVLPECFGRLLEYLGLRKKKTEYEVNKSAVSNTENSNWGEYIKLMAS